MAVPMQLLECLPNHLFLYPDSNFFRSIFSL
jgi:hypothetical protein